LPLDTLLNQNAQVISTHSQLVTSFSNRWKRLHSMRRRSCFWLAPFFRGGDWECRAYYVVCLLPNTLQIYTLFFN